MRLIKINGYLDGGTIILETDEGTFYIDRRIGTKTPEQLYDKYPDKPDAEIIRNDIIKSKLVNALENELRLFITPLRILKGEK
jgi:hypothetical protein